MLNQRLGDFQCLYPTRMEVLAKVYMQWPQGRVGGKMRIYSREVKEMNGNFLLQRCCPHASHAAWLYWETSWQQKKKKGSILKLDNNRKDPPCVAVF